MRNVMFILLVCFPAFVFTQCLKGDCSNGKGRYEFENGSIYFGQFRNSQLHGTGTMKYASGDIYSGQWVDNKKNGGGKFERANGNIYEGKFVENKLNGKGRLIYASGDKYVGVFVNNVPNGKGKIYFKNGNKYEGDVVDGKMDGRGRMEYKAGHLYTGDWKQNKKHGSGFYQWASGKSVEGVWVEGKRDKTVKPKSRSKKKSDKVAMKSRAIEIYTYFDGTEYIGPLSNGKPDGEGKVFYANGNVYKGGWKDHMPEGYGVMYFNNGFKYATQWNQGVPGIRLNDEVRFVPKEKYLPVENNEEVRIYAMVVGVSSYNHMPSLKYTDDDAYQFYAFLKSPEGGAVPDSQIELLIDDAATKNAILEKMQSLYRKADDNDVVLMYFAGHGIDGSFVPADFDGYNNTLAHRDVTTILDNSRAKHKICIADACHSGGLYASRSALSSSLENYYTSFESTKAGTALLLSSKRNEVSMEYDGLRQGVFSHFLIKGLKGEANVNEDKFISVSEIHDYVQLHVGAYTANRQNPSLSGDFDPQMPIAMVR